MSSQRIDGLRRLALVLMTAALAAFHGRLLWQRWADGSFTDPAVGGRWAASALLVAGFVWLYRHRGSLFRGREASVLWILVLLLHALAGVPAGEAWTESASWLALPLVVATAGAVAAARRLSLAGPSTPARPALASDSAAPLTGERFAFGARAPPRA